MNIFLLFDFFLKLVAGSIPTAKHLYFLLIRLKKEPSLLAISRIFDLLEMPYFLIFLIISSINLILLLETPVSHKYFLNNKLGFKISAI